jgi:hypothetical protein
MGLSSNLFAWAFNDEPMLLKFSKKKYMKEMSPEMVESARQVSFFLLLFAPYYSHSVWLCVRRFSYFSTLLTMVFTEPVMKFVSCSRKSSMIVSLTATVQRRVLPARNASRFQFPKGRIPVRTRTYTPQSDRKVLLLLFCPFRALTFPICSCS